MKSVRKKSPKTALQELFVKRLQEELDARGLSQNQLAARAGGPPQKTLNDVMNGADPRLHTISQIATALGIQPWSLFIEKSDIDKATRGRGILSFPSIPRLANSGEISQKEARYRNKKA